MTSDPKKAWDIAESVKTCFLLTGKKQVPMSAMPRREEGAIYFLTDAGSEKVADIEADPGVQLSFTNHSGNEYLFIDGDATVSDDRSKIKDLFSPFAKAWWDSPDDPNIRLITVVPNTAEFWDGPNSVIAAAKMLFAAASGGRPDMGENRETNM
ncbi:pyridoxamine 5'-phosphate oxidase family protein [Phyllobacterium sp. YR531]|uniref:pyridoxamine 5'-phosphate oxidase family protein n=1 Tax=Phyllobacterium sp. YR531 TaxID=1144343 RepID=UPI00026FB22B|nr:pyridoxamine 5'-phosphate oxidase family protein [Phyllobacterium sp. YR531]EJN04197.1 putative stress protein (general stress protein 26) [Phyllobacterium sp. YR531]